MLGQIRLGLFLLTIKANGSAELLERTGRSFEGYASGACIGRTVHKTVAEAVEKAREWTASTLDLNDKAAMVREYDLTPDDLEFARRTWPSEIEMPTAQAMMFKHHESRAGVK